jgi:hypothetical protein
MSSWEQSNTMDSKGKVRECVVQEAQDGVQFRGLVNKGFHEIGGDIFWPS